MRSRSSLVTPSRRPVSIYPIVQCWWCAACLGCYQFYRCPQRRAFTAVLLHRTDCSFFDFGKIFVCLVHDSILSRFGASSKPGAIHYHQSATEFVGMLEPTPCSCCSSSKPQLRQRTSDAWVVAQLPFHVAQNRLRQ